ncbi:hypothetical protein N0B44_28440 [Roseibacterium beibuensis]|uniref:Uncharacterized protein n=1 Tax=[Roseibacterium] beibuensis TaxID=1193142 RepID=A0ABP9LLC7_9RHOB|nr:hypothetical protein [Roseibacterium beibuensis]
MDITKYLAIYAAVLSTAVFVWNVARARPKFDVKLVLGLDETDGEYTSGVYVSLQNPSAHTVHISNVSFLYRYEETGLIDRVKHAWEFKRLMRRVGWVHNSMIFDGIETGLPVSLEPGKSHMIFVPYDTIDDMLERGIDRKIIAGAQDALWRNKYSAVFDFPVMRDPDQDEDDGGEDNGVYIARPETKQIEQKEAAPENAA